MHSCKKETKLCGEGREGHFKHTKGERQHDGRERSEGSSLNDRNEAAKSQGGNGSPHKQKKTRKKVSPTEPLGGAWLC